MDNMEGADSYQPQKEFSVARAANIPERIKQWRHDLLKDMTLLPKVNNQQPGRIVVYGNHAVPILTAAKQEHVVIAAAEIGENQGRIVVISHHKYLKNFEIKHNTEHVSILHENINHWVTKGEFANEHEIFDVKGLQDDSAEMDLSKHKILILDSHHVSLAPAAEENIMDFILNGGALVYGICPHKWRTRNPEKAMDAVPLSTVLAHAGIALSEDKVPYSQNGEGVTVEPNTNPQELALAHVHHLVEACCSETSGETLQQHAQKFVGLFHNIPTHVTDTVKDMLYTLFAKCNEVVHTTVPNPEDIIKDKRSLGALGICSVLSVLQLGYIKMPGIEHFPGDLTEDETLNLKCADIEIKSFHKEAHPTGYWVPAGQKIKVQIISHLSSDEEGPNADSSSGEEGHDGFVNDWGIRIGSHSDSLYYKDSLKRWPHIMVTAHLKPYQEIFTPYGGLLYLLSPNTPSQISVQVSGVLEAPYYDLKEPTTIENWATIRQAKAPWADICGLWFRITVPSSSVRDLVDPAAVMKLWDSVVLGNHELRGTKPNRREWLVTDVQPVVGRMHSGYPIVSHMNVAAADGALSLERMSTVGFWGVFHELGHNMQRNMWTYEGTREVTCNIFALYAANHVAKQPVWIHDWLKRHFPKIQKYLDNGADFNEWQATNGIALAFYVQLAHHFGWQSYRKVFWRYETLPPKKRPTSRQDKIDEWIIRFSDAVGYNLIPLADFWGMPLSKFVVQKLGSLKPLLPEDEITAMAPERVKVILEKYSNNLTREVDINRLNQDKHWCPLV